MKKSNPVRASCVPCAKVRSVLPSQLRKPLEQLEQRLILRKQAEKKQTESKDDVQ